MDKHIVAMICCLPGVAWMTGAWAIVKPMLRRKAVVWPIAAIFVGIAALALAVVSALMLAYALKLAPTP